MGQHFADKLRDIANQESENDEALIQRINLMFDRYAPELKEQIPEGIQNDLIKSAKKKQYEMTVSTDYYLRSELQNQKAITADDCPEDIKTLKNIFIQSKSNPLMRYTQHLQSQQLECKIHGDRYEIYYGNDGIFIFSITFGINSLAKVLKNEGFEVSVSGPKKLRVKW